MSATLARPRPSPLRHARAERDFGVQLRSLGDDGDRVFEALVSVFGNVDSYGDRMMPGCFTNTLQEWELSGDPLPVVWSHQWQDPFAHIGQVLEARESLDGLVVTGRIDREGPLAERAYKLLKERRVKQFSFAFSYVSSEPARNLDGSPELDDWGWPIQNVNEVKLYEVGPCLVGANPSTQLYQVRSLRSDGRQVDPTRVYHLGADGRRRQLSRRAPARSAPRRAPSVPAAAHQSPGAMWDHFRLVGSRSPAQLMAAFDAAGLAGAR